MADLKVTFCSTCRAPIHFLTTKAGKQAPVDPGEVSVFVTDKKHKPPIAIVTVEGEVVRGFLKPTDAPAGVMMHIVRGYISHFATCPAAHLHRKEKRKDDQR